MEKECEYTDKVLLYSWMLKLGYNSNNIGEHRFCETQENDNACNEGYETPSDVTLLCNFHYKTWHREYKQACPTHIKCSTCGKVISDLSKSRAFPEPEILQTFLRENTDFTGELSPNDRVCYICYRSHLSIVKHCKASVKSLDSDLRELINSIQKRQCKVEEISSYDDALDYAAKFVAVILGECLIKQTAALLPKLFEALREKLLEITHKRVLTSLKISPVMLG